MLCVYCLHKKTNVTNSRPNTKTFQVWRRRSCPMCHNVFSTRESVDAGDILIVDDGSGKPTSFSGAVLLSSIVRSIDHLPNIDETAYWITQTIQSELLRKTRLQNTGKVVSVKELRATAALALKRFNYPAYAKYAANHGLRINRREQ